MSSPVVTLNVMLSVFAVGKATILEQLCLLLEGSIYNLPEAYQELLFARYILAEAAQPILFSHLYILTNLRILLGLSSEF